MPKEKTHLPIGVSLMINTFLPDLYFGTFARRCSILDESVVIFVLLCLTLLTLRRHVVVILIDFVGFAEIFVELFFRVFVESGLVVEGAELGGRDKAVGGQKLGNAFPNDLTMNQAADSSG